MVELSVGDVNDAPEGLAIEGLAGEGLSGEGLAVAENRAGADIGRLSAHDDDGDALSFAVDDPRFEVVGDMLKLKAGEALDHEDASSLTLTLTATDGDGAETRQVVELSVGDVNDAPEGLAISGGFQAEYFDVNHNLQNLADVDWDATPTATEVIDEIDYTNSAASFWDGGSQDTFGVRVAGNVTVETGGTYTFSLSGDDGARLFIDGVEVIDNDGLHAWATESAEVTLDPGAHHVEVRYFENTGHAGLNLSWDGPDTNGVETLSGSDAFVVTENAEGVAIANLSASDQDAGDSVVFSVDDARFEVVGTMLKLKDGVSLDHEAGDTVPVTVIATDSGGLQSRETIEINVTDVNDAPVSLTLDNMSVSENADGAVVGQLQANDDDGDALSFAVDDARFEVVDGALKLRDGVSFDYETETEVTVEVTATDTHGASTSQMLTINIDDINETALDITVTGAGPDDSGIAIWLDAGDVDGDGHADRGGEMASGVWVDKSGNDNHGTLVGEMPEQNDVGLDIGSADGRFTVDSDSTINSGTFTQKTFAISFETGDSVDGMQVLYEQGGGTRGYSVTIAEHPETGEPTLYGFAYNKREWADDQELMSIEIGPVEPNQFYSVALVHDATADNLEDRVLDAYLDGTHAGQLTHVDVQYNHPDAVGIGRTNNTTVHPVTGETIRSTGQFDGTISEVISWNRAFDADDVARLNQHFDSNATQQENIAALMEDAVGGSTVATLAAQDDSQSGNFTFAFVDDNGTEIDHALLELVGNEVRLKPGAVLDHETADQVIFDVRVSDGNGNSVVEEITLNVLDVNEAPTDLSVDVSQISEDAQGGAVVGTASATDQDTGESLTYKIVDGANRPIDHPLFEIVGDEIRLKDDADLDYDTASSHEIRIAVTDSGGNTTATTATIEVTEAQPESAAPPAPAGNAPPSGAAPPGDDSSDFHMMNTDDSGSDGWVASTEDDATDTDGDGSGAGSDDPMNEDVVIFDQQSEPSDTYAPYERSDW